MELHFQITQEQERVNISELFRNFLSKRNCSNLILTSTEGFQPTDCFFISALTKTIVMEYKVRDISITKYSDTIIQFNKWKTLYDWHRAGNTAFYCVEFQDAITLWNISDFFNKECCMDLDFAFVQVYATHNTADYQHGQTEKWFRYLSFHNAQFILDKDYNQRDYNYILELHRKNVPAE